MAATPADPLAAFLAHAALESGENQAGELSPDFATQVAIQLDRTTRYLRYLPPTSGWGNIAELEFYGCDAVPSTPASLWATTDVCRVSLAWTGTTTWTLTSCSRVTGL